MTTTPKLADWLEAAEGVFIPTEEATVFESAPCRTCGPGAAVVTVATDSSSGAPGDPLAVVVEMRCEKCGALGLSAEIVHQLARLCEIADESPNPSKVAWLAEYFDGEQTRWTDSGMARAAERRRQRQAREEWEAKLRDEAARSHNPISPESRILLAAARLVAAEARIDTAHEELRHAIRELQALVPDADRAAASAIADHVASAPRWWAAVVWNESRGAFLSIGLGSEKAEAVRQAEDYTGEEPEAVVSVDHETATAIIESMGAVALVVMEEDDGLVAKIAPAKRGGDA